MKIVLQLTKNNRPIYSKILRAFKLGASRKGVKVTDALAQDADLLIACSRTPQRTVDMRQFSKKHNIPLVMCDTTSVGQNGLVQIDARDENRVSRREDGHVMIYCDQGQRYTRNQQSSKINWNLDSYATKGHVPEYNLIIEQIRPEANQEQYDSEFWLSWLENILPTIEKPVYISLHPNRTIPEWAFSIDRYKSLDVQFKSVLNYAIPLAKKVYTYSSWGVLEAVVRDVPVHFEDKTSPLFNCNESGWLKDFSWCFWSLNEIANGDYFDYYNEQNKRQWKPY